MNIEYFSRKETLDLTKLTSNQLQYLERINIIIPFSLDESGKSTRLYSWKQLIGIHWYKSFKSLPSFDIFILLDYLIGTEIPSKLKNPYLYFLMSDNGISMGWVEKSSQVPIYATSCEQYSVIIIDPQIAINELWVNAENSKVVNFEKFKKRVKL